MDPQLNPDNDMPYPPPFFTLEKINIISCNPLNSIWFGNYLRNYDDFKGHYLSKNLLVMRNIVILLNFVQLFYSFAIFSLLRRAIFSVIVNVVILLSASIGIVGSIKLFSLLLLVQTGIFLIGQYTLLLLLPTSSFHPPPPAILLLSLQPPALFLYFCLVLSLLLPSFLPLPPFPPLS